MATVMKRGIVLPTAIFVTLAAAGCGGPAASSSPGTAKSGPVSVASALPAYDPPHHFSSAAVNVGNGPVALADGVAYSYSDTGLLATTLATGSPRWSVSLPGVSDMLNGATSQTMLSAPGIVANATGGSLIVAAYSVTVTGSGTQQDKNEVQVVAVNPAGQVVWRQTIAASVWVPHVVGQLHDTRGAGIVIDAGDLTAVLDAGSGTTWWTAPNIQPLDVDGDVVIGVQTPDDWDWTGMGLRGTDGTQSWNAELGRTGAMSQPPSVMASGTGRAVVNNGVDAVILIDTTTGKTVAKLANTNHVPVDIGFRACRFDGRATVVCWESPGLGSDYPAQLAGFDSHDGHPLWTLTDHDPNRTTITVTCVYHGVVYGNARHGAIELDARTGSDLVDDPGLAPNQVAPGWGLDTGPSSDHPAAVSAYHATD